MRNICCCILLLLCAGSAISQQSQNIQLLYTWSDSTLPATSFHDNTYNEIWGYANNGKEYAIIGSTMGTHIFDITDIGNVDTTVFIPGESTGTMMVHRDYDTYQGYLYIVSDENQGGGINSTLKIVNLNALPDSAPVVFNSDTFFTRSHNIFIDTSKARLYTCGGDNNNGLRVFSLSNPVSPFEMVNFTVAGSYAHDVYVRNDTAFANCGTDGLFIYNFSNITSPQLIGSLTSYPDSGYNHSGWLNPAGNIYALADETFGMKVKLVDVSDLGNITVPSTVFSGVDALSIPHNLIFKDNFLYVSHYNDGLYIYDISDANNPVKKGFYDTSTEPHISGNYRGAWGVYPFLPSGKVLVSDMQNGLFVFDVSAAVGVPDNLNVVDRIEIVPNPFDDEVKIEFGNSQKGVVKIQLFDMYGNKVVDKSVRGNTTINTDRLSTGMYILKAIGDGVKFNKKLIKVN